MRRTPLATQRAVLHALRRTFCAEAGPPRVQSSASPPAIPVTPPPSSGSFVQAVPPIQPALGRLPKKLKKLGMDPIDLHATNSFLGFSMRATHPAAYRHLVGHVSGHAIIDPEETLLAMRKALNVLKKVRALRLTRPLTQPPWRSPHAFAALPRTHIKPFCCGGSLHRSTNNATQSSSTPSITSHLYLRSSPSRIPRAPCPSLAHRMTPRAATPLAPTPAQVSFRGGRILFVSSQPMLSRLTRVVGQQSGQFYLSKRWIPGILTNWEKGRSHIRRK